jgi:carboxyl-terminal processing protease
MRTLSLWLALLCGACSPTEAPELAVAAAPVEAPAAAKPVPNAKAVFQEVLRLISEKYVDANLSEDEQWTGAIEGVLGRLIQLKEHKVNSLIDPESLKEMTAGLKGQVSGVGIVIAKVEDVVYVREVLPGSSAARASIKAGDRILAIDGKSLRGLSMTEIVNRIRGKNGTTVTLLVQRETENWNETLERRALHIDSVTGELLPDGVGYLRIANFTEGTAASLDARLASLSQGGAKRLVLDLRDCPGGLFDAALAVAERFLSPGDRILSLRRRAGNEEWKTVKKSYPHAKTPVVVLVNHGTASGAEIVAGALSQNGRATLVGDTTLGKGTVEQILELSGGWALRLSLARFYSPKGESWQGKGLTPDFLLPAAEKTERSVVRSKVSMEHDPQLKAAVSVLRFGAR